jgi:ComF family protein
MLKTGWDYRRCISVPRTVRRLRTASLDLLFPPECVSCQCDLASAPADAMRRVLCAECVEQLPLFAGALCGRCGAPLPDGVGQGDKGCYRCRDRKLWFDAAVAAGEYTGRLRELVLQMKPKAGDRVSLALGGLVFQHCRERLRDVQADVVVPVPMHWRRRFLHGTNSAAVLAEVLARRLKVTMANGLLRRLRHTQPQSTRTTPQRWTNVRGAFAVSRGHRMSQAHVILVDDIMTTGATCSEAARALKKAGAQRITVVVVARALAH